MTQMTVVLFTES